MSVSDEGHLRYIRTSGDELIDAGRASGTMPGTVVVRFTYNGNPTVYARFTIYAHAGSISGYAKGHLSNPTSASPSFRGALSLGGGGGRYAHARGSGELYGVFDRRSYAMTVQTRGRLTY
ncbi:MAG: autotransporter [Solirubrobacteraceae bacterium]